MRTGQTGTRVWRPATAPGSLPTLNAPYSGLVTHLLLFHSLESVFEYICLRKTGGSLKFHQNSLIKIFMDGFCQIQSFRFSKIQEFQTY